MKFTKYLKKNSFFMDNPCIPVIEYIFFFIGSFGCYKLCTFKNYTHERTTLLKYMRNTKSPNLWSFHRQIIWHFSENCVCKMALNCTALVKRQLQNYKMMYHILDTCQQAQCALVQYRLNPFTEFKGLKEMGQLEIPQILFKQVKSCFLCAKCRKSVGRPDNVLRLPQINSWLYSTENLEYEWFSHKYNC